MKTSLEKMYQEEQKQAAITRLRELAPIGTTLYTIVRHVSSNDMARRISVYVIRDNVPVLLDHLIEKLGYYTYDRKHEGLIVRGVGMDRGCAVVYDSSYEVWKGETDHDSGYAWEQRWL